MKKILVPTDLSDIAALGLQLAVEIARRTRAEINLVNFTKHPLGKSFTATGDINKKVDSEEEAFALQLLKANQQKLENLAASFRDEGIAIETGIVDEEFKDGLDGYLQERHVDLIVMGTSGEENAKESFTGNHTEQAIKISHCPVVSVRDGFDIQNFTNIVVAVNVLTDNQVATGLKSLQGIAACFGATLHLVHVRDEQASDVMETDYFRQMAKIAGLEKYKVVVLSGSDRAAAIGQYAQEVKAGLIAVMKDRKDGIFRIFSNRLSDQLVKEEGRPVVTVNLRNA